MVFSPENIYLPPPISLSLSLSLSISEITNLFLFLDGLHIQHSTRKKVIRKDKYSKASFHYSHLWTTYPIVDIFDRSTSKCKHLLSTILLWKRNDIFIVKWFYLSLGIILHIPNVWVKYLCHNINRSHLD